MKSSIFQKMNQKIWRISTLRVFIVHRAEILQIFWFIFRKIDDFINPFWLNLTFSISCSTDILHKKLPPKLQYNILCRDQQCYTELLFFSCNWLVEKIQPILVKFTIQSPLPVCIFLTSVTDFWDTFLLLCVSIAVSFRLVQIFF